MNVLSHSGVARGDQGPGRYFLGGGKLLIKNNFWKQFQKFSVFVIGKPQTRNVKNCKMWLLREQIDKMFTQKSRSNPGC